MELDPSHFAYAGLLLAAPYWYPAVRSLVADIRAVALAPDAPSTSETDAASAGAEGAAPRDAAPPAPPSPAPKRRGGPLANPLWATGRRVGLAPRVTPERETPAPPRPRGFGRRPF